MVGDVASGSFSSFDLSLSADGSLVVQGRYQGDINGQNSGLVRVYDYTTALSTAENDCVDIGLFPNPTSDIVTVQINTDTNTFKKVSLINMLGQKVMTSSQATFSVGGLPKSIYIVEIETAHGMGVQKLIIN